MWRKIFWSKIELNSEGEASFATSEENPVVGEIHTVRVDVGDSGPETKVEITTSEGETIVYQDIKDSFVDYPIHSGGSLYMSFSGGEKADNLVRYLNHGSLIVRVFGSPETFVQRIVVVVEV